MSMSKNEVRSVRIEFMGDRVQGMAPESRSGFFIAVTLASQDC